MSEKEKEENYTHANKIYKKVFKVSSSTNTLAPEGANIFICRHLNYLVDVSLHGKLADFGNCNA